MTLQFCKKSGQKQIQQRITLLIKSISESPFEGLGKPEALKHNWAGMWSRRINKEHRLIYEVKGDIINIYSPKDHY